MERIRRQLLHLKKKHNLVALKGGTEVEAMSFQEIALMRRISQDILPMTVKIGGVEARNDITFMLEHGIDRILAPMIESPYGLKNFVRTMEECDPEHKASLAVNIETIHSFYSLNAIMAASDFKKISQVTVGRSDLSGSMGHNVEDTEVTRVTREIIELASEMGCATSVGGKIRRDTVKRVQETIPANTVNTRHMVIRLDSSTIEEDVEKALAWEKIFYQTVEDHFPSRRQFCRDRIRSIESRMGHLDKAIQTVSIHS